MNKKITQRFSRIKQKNERNALNEQLREQQFSDLILELNHVANEENFSGQQVCNTLQEDVFSLLNLNVIFVYYPLQSEFLFPREFN